jgi:hypothetical protein
MSAVEINSESLQLPMVGVAARQHLYARYVGGEGPSFDIDTTLVALGDVARMRGDNRCARRYYDAFLACP